MNDTTRIDTTTAKLVGSRIGWQHVALVAALYIITGWLGLGLARPPGFASPVWPAAGLAVAAVILGGPRLALGVFIGSALINLAIGGGLAGGSGPLLVALTIASGSAAQALAAAALLHRVFGHPLRIGGPGAIILALVGVLPVACVVAASVGVGILLIEGLVSRDEILRNWLTWWIGDLIGTAVFLPLALLNPWRGRDTVLWRGTPAPAFTVGALSGVLVTLALTFYAWATASDAAHRSNQTAFDDLAETSRRALVNRMESYRQSLDGGAGLYHAMEDVSLTEWRAYVETLDIAHALPGISGIGFIEPVAREDRDGFLAQAARDGVQAIRIHPETGARMLFVIKYIEPVASNREAVGLDIAFESNRYNAAVAARDTGLPTITGRIFLVQDSTRSAGFLLLRPLYRGLVEPEGVEERRQRFLGWIYAPFIGSRFLEKLTHSQGKSFTLSVYDGPEVDPDQLIYSDRGETPAGHQPVYTKVAQIPIMEKTWTLAWESTPSFEQAHRPSSPAILLGGGLALSTMIAVLLLSFVRREDAIRDLVSLKTRELATRENQTRSIVETAAIGILLLARDGTVLSCNEASASMFGRTPDSLSGLRFYDHAGGLSPQRLEHIAALGYGRAAKGGERLVLELGANGDERFLEVHANAWATDEGEERITVILLDITEELVATRQLQETEARWNSALTGGGIGVFDIDLQRGRFVVSDTWRRMLGFAADTEVGRDAWLMLIHQEDLAAVEAAERDCIEGRTDRAISEYRIRPLEQDWIWMRSDATVTERGPDGRALRIVGTQIDVTALKEATQALRVSEAHFRAAIEHAPSGISLEAHDGGWSEVNGALCSFVGYSRGELSGLSLRDLMHEDDRDEDARISAQLIAGKMETDQSERRFIRKDGSVVWGLVSRSVAHGADERPAYFIAQVQDIDEQKQVERIKNEFISTVSHELRTPLTSIRGALGLMIGAGDADIPDRTRRLLDIAQSNCDRLIVLVNDILDLEKLASGEMRFFPQRREIVEMIGESVTANQSFATQFDVDLEYERAVDECYCRIDPDRLEQVMANLLSNAVKFSERGSPVRVRTELRGPTIRISVEDHGPGIPHDFHDKIFERFSQEDSSNTRKLGGTGLGLHIARQIVEHMGGTIGFDTELGKGTTFWIDLPVVIDEEPEDAGLDDQGSLGEEVGGPRPTILHVEDDREFAELLRLALREDADVVSAFTLKAGRTHLRKGQFDLVMIDWELPDGNGARLLEAPELRDSAIPVIGLSAYELSRPEPRIVLQIIKSRTPYQEIIAIVRSILIGARASVPVSDAPPPR